MTDQLLHRGPIIKKLRIAFIHAPDLNYADTQNYGAKFMPVWAYTLASHIPDSEQFDLKLFDIRFQSLKAIAEADIYLFSGMNQDCGSIEKTRSYLKQQYPKATSMIGGPICWSFDQANSLEQLNGFDHIFIGDGEDYIKSIVEDFLKKAPLARVIRAKQRFDIKKARPFYRPMLDATINRYYGAVLEVSRGCPFLCEFCDIRILKDNNRPHNKSIDLIVKELDHLSKLGVKQVLLACDNFIGDPKWAEELLDNILMWQKQTGFRPSLYTWLTINLYKHKRMMEKMRKTGFDMLFIGVESFDKNSLLETAKLQNTAPDMVKVVREIQSYGFIIVAGLIFGFDSDTEDCFNTTLTGLLNSALLSGDPSLLTALPGTPLYRRMKLSGRLRSVRFGLGGYKYQTNIKYILSAEKMFDGYKGFVNNYTKGKYQYNRLKAYFDLLETGNFIPLEGKGFGNLSLFLKMILKNKAALSQMLIRLLRFSATPSNLFYLVCGFFLVFNKNQIYGRFGYFQFWLFAWTNAVLKYKNLSLKDFDIEGVEKNFDIRNIIPKNYATSAKEEIPPQKIKAQLRTTVTQLESIVSEHLIKLN